MYGRLPLGADLVSFLSVSAVIYHDYPIHFVTTRTMLHYMVANVFTSLFHNNQRRNAKIKFLLWLKV